MDEMRDHSVRSRSKPRTRRAAAVGITGHVGVVLSVALFFAFGAISGDMLYMFPQGLIGLWLIAICFYSTGISKPLRAIGLLGGIGLVLIAVSGAIIGGALGWQIFDPRTTPSVAAEAVSSHANGLGHKLIRLITPARKD